MESVLAALSATWLYESADINISVSDRRRREAETPTPTPHVDFSCCTPIRGSLPILARILNQCVNRWMTKVRVVHLPAEHSNWGNSTPIQLKSKPLSATDQCSLPPQASGRKEPQ